MRSRVHVLFAIWVGAASLLSPSVARPSAQAATAPQTRAAAPHALPNLKDSVKFAVIGDSGTGRRAQYEVAQRLVDSRKVFPFTFVIMLGDNLYGRERPRDYLAKFEKPYAPLLDGGVKFYASLGNHDEPNQRYYKAFNMDGKRYYTFKQGDVRFFVMDSNYLDPDQVTWMKQELSTSNEKWKIAYGHHPLYSSGQRHGSEIDLRNRLEPLFLQHGVSAAFAGHEHFYERIKPQKGITYFISGGAAKLRRGNIHDQSLLTAKGFDTDNSYMLVEIAGEELHFQAISRTGQIVDSGVAPRVAPAAAAPTRD